VYFSPEWIMRSKSPDSLRPVHTLALCAAVLLLPAASLAGDIIDLKNGARTWLYGDRYNGNPPVGDFYGWAMAFGDMDGDGHTDFLSSSGNSDGPSDLHGPSQDVYLIFGGHAQKLTPFTPSTNPAALTSFSTVPAWPWHAPTSTMTDSTTRFWRRTILRHLRRTPQSTATSLRFS
jgi:hypothetical protein